MGRKKRQSGGIIFIADYTKPISELPLSDPLEKSDVLHLGYEPFYKVVYNE